MKKANQIKWMKKPESQNYPAAQSYLSLIYPESKAAKYVKKLKKAPVLQFKAKDIFRASHLSLTGVSNIHVEKDKMKIKKHVPLSPILLVRDSTNEKVVIADGYHRICAAYGFDEETVIPCKIV